MMHLRISSRGSIAASHGMKVKALFAQLLDTSGSKGQSIGTRGPAVPQQEAVERKTIEQISMSITEFRVALRSNGLATKEDEEAGVVRGHTNMGTHVSV